MNHALKVLFEDLEKWEMAQKYCLSKNNFEDALYIRQNKIDDLKRNIDLIQTNGKY